MTNKNVIFARILILTHYKTRLKAQQKLHNAIRKEVTR